MTTALVPLNPDAGPPAPVFRQPLDREEILCCLEALEFEALIGGSVVLATVLERVVIALRGARGVDLATDLLLFLKREQLLEVVHDGRWIRARDYLDLLSPTGVFTVVDAEDPS